MLEELRSVLGLPLMGFRWKGPVNEWNKKHCIEFMGLEGEIYIKPKGIMTYKDYYKFMLNQGFCLLANDLMIYHGDKIDSPHYQSLTQVLFKRSQNYETKKAELMYPVIDLTKKAVFESAVTLYEQGLLSVEQLQLRIQRYIIPEEQVNVFNALTQTLVPA